MSDNKNFKEWLLKIGISKNAANSICSRINRIATAYNIEDEYNNDKCAELINDFTYTSNDAKNSCVPNIRIIINGSYIKGMRSLKRALELYVEYLDNTYIRLQTKSKKNITPCFFEGTFDDFIRFTGPKCRNKIQAITKSKKKQVINCECCGKKATLEAAHRKGFERNEIIKDILDKNYTTKTPGIYRVNLHDFENKFKNAHSPLEDVFFFLCSQCHDEYDGKNQLKSNLVETKVIANRSQNNIII